MTKLAASALTAEHIGRTLRVKTGGIEVTGVLQSVEQAGEIVSDTALCDWEPRYVVGERSTTIRLLGLEQSLHYRRGGEVTLMT